MNCGCTSPVPAMHVSKDLSELRRNAFLPMHKVLSDAMGSPENLDIRYDAAMFQDFLTTKVIDPGCDYLRTYFASFSNSLNIIYATNVPGQPGKEIYYTLTPRSFNVVSAMQASYNVAEYRLLKLPLINDLPPTLPEGNTVCIKHAVNDIVGFRDEIACQRPSSIRACFAVYHPTGAIFKSRLHIEYVLMKTGPSGVEFDFYIDADCDDFPDRPLALAIHEFNNGTLCPPCTGCDSANIGLFPPC